MSVTPYSPPKETDYEITNLVLPVGALIFPANSQYPKSGLQSPELVAGKVWVQTEWTGIRRTETQLTVTEMNSLRDEASVILNSTPLNYSALKSFQEDIASREYSLSYGIRFIPSNGIQMQAQLEQDLANTGGFSLKAVDYLTSSGFRPFTILENLLVLDLIPGSVSIVKQGEFSSSNHTLSSSKTIQGTFSVFVSVDNASNHGLAPTDEEAAKIQKIIKNLLTVRDQATFTVSNSTTNIDYHIAIENSDPAIAETIILQRGGSYQFINDSGGHPFYIQSSEGIRGIAYGHGVTGNGSKSITFHVPQDAPNELYYQCSSHAKMNGKIFIVDNKDSLSNELLAHVGSKVNQFAAKGYDINIMLKTDNLDIDGVSLTTETSYVNLELEANGTISHSRGIQKTEGIVQFWKDNNSDGNLPLLGEESLTFTSNGSASTLTSNMAGLIDLTSVANGDTYSVKINKPDEAAAKAAIEVSDAVDVLKDIVGLYDLTGYAKNSGDMDGDGVIELSDAISILKIAAGLESGGTFHCSVKSTAQATSINEDDSIILTTILLGDVDGSYAVAEIL